jgi:hypothetical protein
MIPMVTPATPDDVRRVISELVRRYPDEGSDSAEFSGLLYDSIMEVHPTVSVNALVMAFEHLNQTCTERPHVAWVLGVIKDFADPDHARPEPEVEDARDRGFVRGVPRFMVQGVKVGCQKSDLGMLTELVSAMSPKPSSFAVYRWCLKDKPLLEMTAFIDVWNEEVAAHIIEVTRRVMIEPYGLHVRGRNVGGQPLFRLDYSRWELA